MKNYYYKEVIFLSSFLMFVMSNSAYGQGPASKGGLYMSYGIMYLASSTSQGGKGAEGSTLLSEAELINKTSFINYGFLVQYDSQGSAQNDLEIAYKIEFEIAPFYIEAGSSLYVQRVFTDRSIANQEGTGYRFGVGVRVPLNSLPGFSMQFSYKQRTQKIEQQDGKPLSEDIEQVDTYPIFGLGYSL